MSGGAEGAWSFSWNTIYYMSSTLRLAALAVPLTGLHLYDGNCTLVSEPVQSLTGEWTNGTPKARLFFDRQMLRVTPVVCPAYGSIEAVLFSGTFEVAATPSGPVAVN